MKRVTYTMLLLGAILLTACTPKQTPTESKLLDKGAMIYINVRNNAMKVTNATDTTTTDDQIPTPREVVERAGSFMYKDHKTGKPNMPLAIAPEQLDVENERIKMWGEMIVEPDGTLNDYFIKLRDLRILAPMRDGETENPIIAYIPNKRMEEAEVAITKAYNDGNYDEVYRLFQELYTAIPTTTARWQALKAKGEQ
jgi:hypothetical protein